MFNFDLDHVYLYRSGHNDEMCNFYMMFYTDAGGGTSYTCSGNQYPDMFSTLPADADVPLPPNPDLEDIAKGVVHEGNYESRNPNDYRTNYRQGLSRYDSRFGEEY